MENPTLPTNCNKNHCKMKQAKLLFLLIAALAFASCRQTARQTVADAEQPTDSTEAVTSADTLRLVITDKSLSQTDSVIRRTLKLPVDSIVVEVINNTDSTCVTGEAYAIEQRVNDVWTILQTEPSMPSTILATNSLHTAPACSLSMLSLTNTTSSEDRNIASSKSSSSLGKTIPKASIVIFHLSNIRRCDPITLCLTFKKNSRDYGEPDITYQLAGCADKLGFEGNTLPDVFYRKQIDVEPSNIQFPMSP